MRNTCISFKHRVAYEVFLINSEFFELRLREVVQ